MMRENLRGLYAADSMKGKLKSQIVDTAYRGHKHFLEFAYSKCSVLRQPDMRLHILTAILS